MNPVIDTLREHIEDQGMRFVFPSQTAAGLWARKTCTLGIARSVSLNRFLAWDRFKEEIIREKGRVPSNSVTRKLFSEALLRKNAGTVCLKSVVLPEYSGSGMIFAPFIARLLPFLSYWEKLTNAVPRDDEDKDFVFIKKEYAAFLERHGLFEPSWEEIEIREDSARYVLFFPELIEDFAEYDSLLQPPRFIRASSDSSADLQSADCKSSDLQSSYLSSADDKSSDLQSGGKLVRYQSAREEIRSAVAEIRKFHEEGIPYEDMAVSVPELDEMEPCLLKEFYLHHVPVSLRAGKKLGETGAGRFFSLLNDCVISGFSFNSLKSLLLNDHVPWREREKNSALISYGIKYNCVSGYLQNGKAVDIWEEAFRESSRDNDGNDGMELRSYYAEMKKRFQSLAKSKNFSEIRNHYFALRSGEGSLLDMEKISAGDDAVLSRCVEELNSLIELEEKFNDSSLVPSSPFEFYLSCLNDKEYVRANQKPGVNIFRWRVAAASPFSCHFVLNASQSAASVLYQPMRFLRQDKRKALGLEDRDATPAFLSLYDTGEDVCFKSHVRISAAAQTFSGWAIPHNFFASGKIMEPPPLVSTDPYAGERLFWKAAVSAETAENSGLKKIYSLQKNAYRLWKETLALKKNDFNFFDAPVPSDLSANPSADLFTEPDPVQELLRNAIQGKGSLSVTPTSDLNVYYQCAIKWLYRRVFGAEQFSLEAALLDDTSLGLLYHRILYKLFERIKYEDEKFDARRLDAYKRWAFEITRTTIEKVPVFKGPLAVPLVLPQAAGMAKKIGRLLEMEAAHFNDYTVSKLEFPVAVKTGSLKINGIIDRVSFSPDGEPVIIDYKTGRLPDQTPLDKLKEVGLTEFQMPLYINLYEETGKSKPVKGAYFYSINERRIKTAMGEGANAPERPDYEVFLEAAKTQIKEFGLNVKALDFIPREIYIGDCMDCPYKTACRSTYFLNRRQRKGEQGA
jgi:hypothetical protein